MKTKFKAHVGREEGCADHCTTYALSDANEKRFARKCLQAHDVQCNNCISLEKVLQDIQDKIDSASMSAEEKNRKKHECRQNVEAIKAWKAHLLRTVNQEEAKQDALSALDEETCLIVMDWAMKFLPQRYRERMSEFFGKKRSKLARLCSYNKEGGKVGVRVLCPYFRHMHTKQLCSGVNNRTLAKIHQARDTTDPKCLLEVRQRWVLP